MRGAHRAVGYAVRRWGPPTAAWVIFLRPRDGGNDAPRGVKDGETDETPHGKLQPNRKVFHEFFSLESNDA